MDPRNFFAELKRRNVYKVAVAYAIVSWLLIQIATQIFPFFEIPNWAVRLVALVIVIGFPIALVCAWAYELTPAGVKKTQEVSAGGSVRRNTGRKLDFFIIFVLVLAVGVLLFQRLRAPSAKQPSSSASKSIAVLPFENRSEDKTNGYFADGIQDEILTRLAKIADLKVISRASTQHYKTAPENLPDIAKQLGVGNILEGSVQKSGDQVRVNVQLINAQTDSHLWAEIYDRKLTDIFAVESEVAKAIAETLKAKLTGSEEKAIAVRPTENPEAYDAYLRGLAIVATYSDTSTSLNKSLNFFAEAVRLDPNFALAWARLSVNYGRTYWAGYDRTQKRQEEAKQAVDRALQLQPDLGEAFLALGYYYYWCRHDFDAASKTFEQARARLPNNPEILAALGYLERRKGKWAEAIAHQGQAVQLSPRDLNILVQFALSYEVLKQFPEAHALVERTLNIAPDHAPTLSLSARLNLAQGNVERAEAIMHPIPPTPAQPYIFEIQIRLALITHRYQDAINMLNAALAIPETGSGIGFHADEYRYLLGFAKQLAGEAPGARAAYQVAAAELEKVRKTQPDTPEAAMYLGFVYAALGEKDKALRAVREAVALDPATKDATNGPAYEEALARVEAQVGEKDAAIAEVERLLHVNYLGPEQIVLTPAVLRLDPIWDPLRADPRFQKLCEEKQPR
jgi:TolB-like protein/Flp pilus assembly protein TadD